MAWLIALAAGVVPRDVYATLSVLVRISTLAGLGIPKLRPS
jgi:hypothetical protein